MRSARPPFAKLLALCTHRTRFDCAIEVKGECRRDHGGATGKGTAIPDPQYASGSCFPAQNGVIRKGGVAYSPKFANASPLMYVRSRHAFPYHAPYPIAGGGAMKHSDRGDFWTSLRAAH